MSINIEKLWGQGSLRDIDYYFADFIRRMSGSDDELLLLTAALTSWAVGENHICIDLNNFAGKLFPADDSEDEPGYRVKLPDIDEWKSRLRAEGIALSVGIPGEVKPLIMGDAGRIYLHRYWQYEKKVAESILYLAQSLTDPEYPPALGDRLQTLFDASAEQGGDIKRLAAFLSLRNRLTIISGGPGTGKTYIVARILALMVEARYHGAHSDQALSVKLAAPTGKAAARMGESIRDAVSELDIPDEIKELMPQEEPATIHRLLGTIPDSSYFRHNAENPLDADVVIVDEASMIDLPMMAKLLDALSPDARLILLGDMNQLASVAPGYVYGDICTVVDAEAFSGDVHGDYKKVDAPLITDASLKWDGIGGLEDCVVKLDYSHRFKPDSDIGKLSSAINSSATNADEVWGLLQSVTGNGDISWRDLPENISDLQDYPETELAQTITAGYKEYLDADRVEDMFMAVKKFRILCAVRNGQYGIYSLNRIVEKVLSYPGGSGATPTSITGGAGATPTSITGGSGATPTKPDRLLNPEGLFYERKLIMVTVNDYSLRLFNGDIGIVLPSTNDEDPENKLYAYFEVIDEDGKQGVRRVPVNMLPATETAFAMTIHKSQGSEFDKVLILLPEAGNRLLTKELLYTGVTRTKEYVDIWCSEQAFKEAIMNKTSRSSGLSERLKVKR